MLLGSMPAVNLEVAKTEVDSATTGAPQYGFDANERTIMLRSTPVFLNESVIRAYVDTIDALRGRLEEVSFSEPLKMHEFERFAWLTFESEGAANVAIKKLDGVTVKVPETFSA